MCNVNNDFELKQGWLCLEYKERLPIIQNKEKKKKKLKKR